MKVLVTGARGLLGHALMRVGAERGHDPEGPGRDVLDVTRRQEVARAVASLEPEAVIHAAAFSRVEEAEARPDEAYRVNRDGTRIVARACADAGIPLLYMSTDYVFDGGADAPYAIDAEARPASVYGDSKLAGERAVRDECGAWLVARSSWLYGAGGGNFVDTVLRKAEAGQELSVVDDQRGRPTWTRSAARLLFELLEREARGVYHVCDRGTATWYELARAALEVAGFQVEVTPVSSAEWSSPAPRPAYSVLDLSGTEALLGRPPPHWRESLERYLEGRP